MFFGGIGGEATRRPVADAGLRLEVLENDAEDEGRHAVPQIVKSDGRHARQRH
jgi:hypothetical protein